MTRGDQRAVDDAAGAVVAAHRVDGDAHQSQQVGWLTAEVSSFQLPASR